VINPEIVHIEFNGVMNLHNRRSGFTLIEMLIVIGLIVVLGSLTILTGRKMIVQGRIRQTQAILENLDSALTEYEAEYKSMPVWTGDYKQGDPESYHPAKRYKEGGTVRPEVAVFLAQAQGIEGVDNVLKAIGPEYLLDRLTIYEEGDAPLAGEVHELDTRLSVRDSWGMEILFVHPDHTDQNWGDDNGAVEVYGKPVSNRPYFMSAGPDLRYADQLDDDPRDDHAGWDNLYSYEVPDRPSP